MTLEEREKLIAEQKRVKELIELFKLSLRKGIELDHVFEELNITIPVWRGVNNQFAATLTLKPGTDEDPKQDD